MPQPLSKRCPNATVSLSPHSLDDNPDLRKHVCWVIAAASEIELEMSLMLVRILGADEGVALAMFDALQGDYLKLRALQSAAQVKLTAEQYKVFSAVTSVANSVVRHRHRLAHWIWGSCPELPNALLVAEPRFLRLQDIERYKAKPPPWQALATEAGFVATVRQSMDMYEYDKSKISVYDEPEFLRARRDITDGTNALFLFRYYLKPALIKGTPFDHLMVDLDTSEGALRRISGLRLYREAAARVQDSDHQGSSPSETE